MTASAAAMTRRMAASRLQTEPASRARLEDELSKLFAQKIAAGRLLGDGHLSAPDGFVAKSQLLIFEKTALSATDVDEVARPCTRSILVFTASGATASACRPIASAPSRIFRPCSKV